MFNLFKSTCKIASKKTEAVNVISALIETSCGSDMTIRKLGDDSYIYEFLATVKQYDAVLDALKGKILIYYRDNFDRESYREP